MKSTLAFLLVNGVFAVASCIAAGIVWIAGNALLVFAPQEADNPWLWYGIGMMALAAAISFVVAAARATQPGVKPWYQSRKTGSSN